MSVITIEEVVEWNDNDDFPMAISDDGKDFLIGCIGSMLLDNNICFDDEYLDVAINMFFEDQFTEIKKDMSVEQFVYKLYLFVLNDIEDNISTAKNELLSRPSYVEKMVKASKNF